MLEQLRHHPAIWRGGELTANEALPTGFQELDVHLPGGGWPVGALTELLPVQEGIGELSLIMPTLTRLTHEGYERRHWLAWVAPPHTPYAPSLAAQGLDLSHLMMVRSNQVSDTLWAAEQIMRSGVFAAVVVWLGSTMTDERSLRRLQLCAETGQCWGVVFRHPNAARNPSPAALRLRLKADHEARARISRQASTATNPGEKCGLVVEVLKCRGGRGAATLTLPGL